MGGGGTRVMDSSGMVSGKGQGEMKVRGSEG